MTPRPLDVASVQAKLRSLDELGSALRLVGEVDGARLGQDVLLRLAVERALTSTGRPGSMPALPTEPRLRDGWSP